MLSILACMHPCMCAYVVQIIIGQCQISLACFIRRYAHVKSTGVKVLFSCFANEDIGAEASSALHSPAAGKQQR